MPRVELVYFPSCPNIDRAREQLARAISLVGAPLTWSEWSNEDPAAPERTRGFGSPTVLVDGREVTGSEPFQGAASCRLYAGEGGPPVQVIATALRRAMAGDAGGPAGKSD